MSALLSSREHYELLTQFEKSFKHLRLDREQDKALWARGIIYQNGETNELFKAFRLGHAYGVATQ